MQVDPVMIGPIVIVMLGGVVARARVEKIRKTKSCILVRDTVW